MTDTLVHRGPDSRGVWRDSERGIGLGSRRLAIRDLSPMGNQPMTSRCGRYVIAYNGEIYSHDELSRDLERASRSPKGTSDTEIILEACAEWGVDKIIQRLNGMFGFALFDKETRELVLARDRVGIKPVYWGVFDDLLIFGSELKPLRQAPCWKPRIDRDALVAYMRHNYIPAPYSIYQGVQKLEPGTMLKVDGKGAVNIERYWDLRNIVEDSSGPLSRPSDAECLAELEELLSDATRRRMVSDVPVGALLSGGVDSSLVTALMAENASRPINTFSLGFAESEYDEAPFGRQVSEHLGTDHTELYVEASDALGLVDKLPHWYDEPFADSSQIPTAIVCELSRKQVSVVLTGDGGDELFAGYNRYQLGLETWNKVNSGSAVLRRFVARGLLTLPPSLFDRLNHLLPSGLQRQQLGEKIHTHAQALLNDDADAIYRSRLSHWQHPSDIVIDGKEPRDIFWDDSLRETVPDILDRMQLLDFFTYLPNDILTKVDRASMAFSLEARVPLLDHRVVERAWSLPQTMKLRDGETKWALRQILDKRVPRTLIERPKMGFGAPIAEWLRGPMRDWAEHLLDEKRLVDQGLFTPEPIRERWQQHLDGVDWAYPLWVVLMAQAWVDANTDVAL
jgi:asparagine synthase (glutamine-hydrolysing)